MQNLAILITILLAGLGVVSDYFLKRASEAEKPMLTVAFLIGLVIYSSLAFGWVYVFRHIKLAEMGVVYSASTMLLLAGMGVFIFKEPIHWRESLGIVFALASILLLARFN
jgi:small multidrug resistance pump